MADTERSRRPQPKASRPQMTGYGVPESLEGALPWEWALERLSKSHNYWLTSVRPDGSPHTMVVWGIWLDGAYYFSTSATSRKARNLQHNSNCVVCSENAEEAVIMEGVARRLDDDRIPQKAFTDYKAKYGWELDPKMGPVHEVRPKLFLPCPKSSFPRASHAGASSKFQLSAAKIYSQLTQVKPARNRRLPQCRRVRRTDWRNPPSKGSYLCRKKQRITTRKPPNIMSTRRVITGKPPRTMKRAITRRRHTTRT